MSNWSTWNPEEVFPSVPRAVRDEIQDKLLNKTLPVGIFLSLLDDAAGNDIDLSYIEELIDAIFSAVYTDLPWQAEEVLDMASENISDRLYSVDGWSEDLFDTDWSNPAFREALAKGVDDARSSLGGFDFSDLADGGWSADLTPLEELALAPGEEPTPLQDLVESAKAYDAAMEAVAQLEVDEAVDPAALGVLKAAAVSLRPDDFPVEVRLPMSVARELLSGGSLDPRLRRLARLALIEQGFRDVVSAAHGPDTE